MRYERMRLFLWETKKIVCSAYIIIAISALFLITAFYCFNEYRLTMPDSGELKTYNKIAMPFEGISNIDTLREILSAERNNMDKSTYKYLNERITDFADRKQNFQKHIQNIMDKLSKFNSEGKKDTEEYVLLENEMKSFNNYEMKFYNNIGAEKLLLFITTTRSSIFLCLFLIVIISPIFSNEFDSQIYYVISPTRNGKICFVNSKIIAYCTFICFIYTVYYLFSVILYLLVFGNYQQLYYPLRSISKFLYSPFNWPIIKFLFINYLLSLLGIILFICLFGMVSGLMKKNIPSFLVCGIISFIPLFVEDRTIGYIISFLSPIVFFASANLHTSQMSFIVGGKVIHYYLLTPIINTILIILCYLAIHNFIMSRRIRGGLSK